MAVLREVPVTAAMARRTANGYLLDHVGDLLQAGDAHLSEGYWVMPILLGNVRQGVLGEVGTISVHAQTGGIAFTAEDLARVEERAGLLAGSSAP
jgi:hypothetical protein